MLLEKLVSIFAPHYCLGCSVEGKLVCDQCFMVLAAQTDKDSVISTPRLPHIGRLWAFAQYSGLPKQLVQALKFDRCLEASEHIAGLLAASGPLSNDCVLVPVRTSPRRHRQRGYDQTVLITRHLSKRTELPMLDVLSRAGNVRQLGATRAERLRQLKGVYRVNNPNIVVGRKIILIDDVVTTGATLEAAAACLLQSGALSVRALVFAAA